MTVRTRSLTTAVAALAATAAMSLTLVGGATATVENGSVRHTTGTHVSTMKDLPGCC